MKSVTGLFVHVFNSKTYGLIILLMIFGFVAVLIAAIFFNKDLWDKWFDQGMASAIAAALRAIGVDGVPKIAASWQDPNSQAANPPGAFQEMLPHPIAAVQSLPPADVVVMGPPSSLIPP